MILNLVSSIFRRKETQAPKESVVIPNLQDQQEFEPEKISMQLMDAYKKFRTQCRLQRVENIEHRSWKVTGNIQLHANDEGLYVLRDEQGRVVKTRDAMRRVREYRYDQEGQLEMSKYGLWSKMPNAGVSESGTLIWKTRERETYECLDGTTICITFSNGSLIAQNEKTGEETAISLTGKIHHVYKKDGVSRVRIYVEGKLVSELETFDESASCVVHTMAEESQHELKHVARIERRFRAGKLVRESFEFFEKRTNSDSIKMSFNLPTGELHLSRVKKIENIYIQGSLVETIFELSEPVSVSRDKEGNVSLIRGISKVRRLKMQDGVASVVFVDSAGCENLHFPQF